MGKVQLEFTFTHSLHHLKMIKLPSFCYQLTVNIKNLSFEGSLDPIFTSQILGLHCSIKCMMNIRAASVIWEPVYICLNCVPRFQSLVSGFCGLFMMLFHVSSPLSLFLSTLKQTITQENVKDLWSCVLLAFDLQPSMFPSYCSTICIFSGNALTWLLPFGNSDVLGIFES